MGGMLMMLMLYCMMLIVYVEVYTGDDDTYGDNNDNDNVAPCCPYCCVTFKTPPIQKHSCFLGFLDKSFATDPKNQQNNRTNSTVFATLSQKPHQKNKTKLLWKKSPKHRLVDENHRTRGFQSFDQKTSNK